MYWYMQQSKEGIAAVVAVTRIASLNCDDTVTAMLELVSQLNGETRMLGLIYFYNRIKVTPPLSQLNTDTPAFQN